MNSISAKEFKKALISGSYSIMNNRDKIDALNVFPVPDGDTGSNMSGTVQSALNAIETFDENHIGQLMKKFSRGAFLGARGNSGVILSQIFEGFAVALETKANANTFDLVEGFKKAQEYAYKSVMKPIEGTILTVIRMTSENLSATITPSNDILTVFEKAVSFARKSCDKTTWMLQELKDNNVTDSGGEGLWFILFGMLSALKGKPINSKKTEIEATKEFIVGFDKEEYDGEFGYCTEGLVELKNHKKFNKDKFKYGLEKIGNSIVVVQNEEVLKVHVHTLKPGLAINFMQKFGEFLKIKSENMTLQANQSKGQKDSHKISDTLINKFEQKNKLEKSEIAVISCNDGRGLIDEMKSLGTDIIIEGGQSNNPSTLDFLNAIKQLHSKNIIILPNNPNIILVAQQVLQTVEDKNVIIIPTKSQVQGITAMFNFDRSNTLEENQELMNEAVDAMNYGQVTIAGKDTKVNGVNVKKGDFLGLTNRKIVASTRSKITSAIAIIDKLANENTEIITIWYGESASKVDAEEVGSYIESNYDAIVEIKHGNQHIYEFIISFE